MTWRVRSVEPCSHLWDLTFEQPFNRLLRHEGRLFADYFWTWLLWGDVRALNHLGDWWAIFFRVVRRCSFWTITGWQQALKNVRRRRDIRLFRRWGFVHDDLEEVFFNWVNRALIVTSWLLNLGAVWLRRTKRYFTQALFKEINLNFWPWFLNVVFGLLSAKLFKNVLLSRISSLFLLWVCW